MFRSLQELGQELAVIVHSMSEEGRKNLIGSILIYL